MTKGRKKKNMAGFSFGGNVPEPSFNDIDDDPRFVELPDDYKPKANEEVLTVSTVSNSGKSSKQSK